VLDPPHKHGAQNDGSQDLIVCLSEEMPPPFNPSYSYNSLSSFLSLLASFAAKILTHHLYYPHKCSQKAMQDIMVLLPKIVNRLLEKKFGVVGWGIKAVPGLALWKCCLALLLSKIPTTMFAVR
jgi:hypothetical protein